MKVSLETERLILREFTEADAEALIELKRWLEAEQEWYLTFTVVGGKITKLHVSSEHDVEADFTPVLGGRQRP
jgi:RimJ/RimL family protein N-acetyltransferase